MTEDVAACPRCARTLRLKTAPAKPCVLTHCPACGADVVLVHGDSLVLVDEKDASYWKFRGILREQGIEIVGSAGSALGCGALLAGALGVTGNIVGAVAAVVVAAIAGAGMGTSIVFDARAGAQMWRVDLKHEEDLLLVEPQGYRG